MYVVVWVGESLTLPESCVPLTRVRVDEPAVAVMVTAVALAACQFSVTLWPLVTALALAERLMLGATFDFEFPHDAELHITAIRVP